MPVEIRHLWKSYEVPVLQDVSFGFPAGSCTLVTGPSGIGKTTLLKIIAGLEQPDAGDVQVTGRVTMVFQEDLLLPHLSAADNILFGLDLHNVPAGQRDEKVLQTARLCHCDQYLHQRASTLSGGQKQRVSLARALVSGPDVVLLDEATSHLDRRLAEELLHDLIQAQKQTGFTLILVTHDLTLTEGCGFDKLELQ